MATRLCSAILPLAIFLAAALLTAPADAAVYKNKATGETLKGTLTPQRVNSMNVFKTDDGKTKYVNPDEWQLVDGDSPAAAPAPNTAPQPPVAPAPSTAPPPTAPAVSPAPQPPAAAPAAAKAGPPVKGGAEPVAYVFPISGAIESHALVEALDTGLAEAKKLKAEVIILRLNTPGGRIDLADAIIKAIEKADGTTLVSFVNGEDRRALSAGAYICMATQKIFMAPGCTLGAATPYTRNSMTGSAEIDEKMISAFRARFRSLAQMRGHPAALADAMVDRNTSVVQVFLDNEPTLVTEDEARRLDSQHRGDNRFKRGKTVSPYGKLITLTSNEALEFKICTAVVANEKELLAQMGKGNCQIVEAKWAAAWIEKTSKERAKKYEDLKAAYRLHIEQAMAFDPQNNMLSPGTAQWKAATDQAMIHLKECARVITELEKMVKDDRYDVMVSEEGVREMKARLDANYRRLGAQRNF